MNRPIACPAPLRPRTTRARRAARAGAATLLALLAVGCAGGDPTAPDATTPDAPASGGTGGGSVGGGTGAGTGGGGAGATRIPAALVGGWRYGTISPTNFWNDHTGTFAGNAYGMSDHYAFGRDGTFREYVYIYTQSYGCRTQVWVEMTGTVQFDAAAFTTRVEGGRFKVADSCAASRNYDRAMTTAERAERSKTRPFALRADGGGRSYLQILDGRYDRVD